MVKPARVPKQNKPKKNSTNISAEENAQIVEKIEALRSEVDSIQVPSKIFEKYFIGKVNGLRNKHVGMFPEVL